ncbi:hypothetical protein [Streptomyces sp. NPDC057696]|uniref:hypothetical protein n=1 Tax=Streptomyces sp. NPDC057696 TaxID=3346218 RepID=UPI0036B4C9DE
MKIRMWESRRQAAAYAALGTVVALLIAALAFVIASPSVPSAWWPRTGDAFAASPTNPTQPAQGTAHAEPSAPGSPAGEPDVCDAIVGPAHDYCLGAPAPEAATSNAPLRLADAWPMGVLAIGITTLYILARRRRGL